MRQVRIGILLAVLLALGLLMGGCAGGGGGRADVHVIYSADLRHPHGDLDDHFDVATLYALEGVSIDAVLLDLGEDQLARPGSIPVSQLNLIQGREVPWAIGLGQKLGSLTDTGHTQGAEYQGAVELLIETLRGADHGFTIITVGSLRDVAAAYNREPDLFHQKVERLYISGGEASNPDFQEWNVYLDPLAFARIMNSGLPVYILPCFDGGLWQNSGRASFYTVTHGDALESVADPLMQFFIYAILMPGGDPLEFVRQRPEEADVEAIAGDVRNMWSTAAFLSAMDRTVVVKDLGGYRIESVTEENAETRLFEFAPTHMRALEDGDIEYGQAEGSHEIMAFQVNDMGKYAAAMGWALREIFIEGY